MTNMTYAQALEIAINAVADETAKEKLIALKDQMAKRTSAKTQKENEVIMERIVDALADVGEAVTVTDLIAHGIEGYDLTNQKVSALLRKLVEAQRVVKTIEGKKAMFRIA